MIAVDANILLDLLEGRTHAPAVRRLIAGYQNIGEELGISTLTASHVFYLAESHKLTMPSVERLIFAYKIYDVVSADISWALKHYKSKDFEDALQVSAAMRSGATSLLTLDSGLFKKYQKILPIKLIK